MNVTGYEKPRTVTPRAFYVRMFTGMVPMVAIYLLFVYNYVKALDHFRSSHVWQFAFTLAYTAAFSGVACGLAVSIKRWCWDTVYIIVGTVRFEGRPGILIPAGVRLQSEDDEYITVSDTKIGLDKQALVEVCVKWSAPYNQRPVK